MKEYIRSKGLNNNNKRYYVSNGYMLKRTTENEFNTYKEKILSELDKELNKLLNNNPTTKLKFF